MLAMLDLDGMVWTMQQKHASSEGWDDWQGPGIGGQKFSWIAITAGEQSGARGIQLMAADDGQVWGCYQMNPGADWSGWSGNLASLSGGQNFDAGELALSGQNNGMLMLFAESGGEIAAFPQTQPGGSWGAWTALGLGGQTEPVKNICACQQGGTRGVQLWGLDGNGKVQTLFQDTAGGQWDPWQVFLDTQPEPFVTIGAAGQNNGCTVFFGVGEKGDLWEVRQTSPGGGWDKWKAMTPPPES